MESTREKEKTNSWGDTAAEMKRSGGLYRFAGGRMLLIGPNNNMLV